MRDANKNPVKIGDKIYDWSKNQKVTVTGFDWEFEGFETDGGFVEQVFAQAYGEED